jgi:hypothetical protein
MDEREQAAAIARLEATVEAMARAVTRLESQAEAQTRQLAAIESRLSEAQGGLRVVLWLGSIATAVVGAIAVWAGRHLHWQ